MLVLERKVIGVKADLKKARDLGYTDKEIERRLRTAERDMQMAREGRLYVCNQCLHPLTKGSANHLERNSPWDPAFETSDGARVNEAYTPDNLVRKRNKYYQEIFAKDNPWDGINSPDVEFKRVEEEWSKYFDQVLAGDRDYVRSSTDSGLDSLPRYDPDGAAQAAEVKKRKAENAA